MRRLYVLLALLLMVVGAASPGAWLWGHNAQGQQKVASIVSPRGVPGEGNR